MLQLKNILPSDWTGWRLWRRDALIESWLMLYGWQLTGSNELRTTGNIYALNDSKSISRPFTCITLTHSSSHMVSHCAFVVVHWSMTTRWFSQCLRFQNLVNLVWEKSKLTKMKMTIIAWNSLKQHWPPKNYCYVINDCTRKTPFSCITNIKVSVIRHRNISIVTKVSRHQHHCLPWRRSTIMAACKILH